MGGSIHAVGPSGEDEQSESDDRTKHENREAATHPSSDRSESGQGDDIDRSDVVDHCRDGEHDPVWHSGAGTTVCRHCELDAGEIVNSLGHTLYGSVMDR